MTPCVLWDKYCTKAGYGQLRRNGKCEYAHRVAYVEANGVTLEDIVGIEVRHKCDNPPCINPEHLELGSHADNMADMKKRKRSPSGERNGQVKLTAEQVAWVRANYIPRHRELGGSAMARTLGVCQQNISDIIHGRRW